MLKQPIQKEAMTAAERAKRSRDKRKQETTGQIIRQGEDSVTVGYKKQKTETQSVEQQHATENATSTIVSEITQARDGTIHTSKTEVKQTTIITDTSRWSYTISNSEEKYVTRRRSEIQALQTVEHNYPLGKLQILIDNLQCEGDYVTKEISYCAWRR